ILESESEENGAYGRAGEPGEDQKAPAAFVDLGKLAELRNQYREKHHQDEDVFPEHDHIRVEEIVKRNAPRTFRPPEGRAEANEPWPVTETPGETFNHAPFLTGVTRVSKPVHDKDAQSH